MVERIGALRGRRVAVLVTGDPTWLSGGVTVARAFPGEAVVHPHPGAFAEAAARMLWRMEDCEGLSVHGRSLDGVLPHLAPGARLLILAHGPETAGDLARLLAGQGWGPSRIVALSHMGGKAEARVEGTAEGWEGLTPSLTTLAVECLAGPGARVLPRTGLPDEAFQSDGTMTKREVRAATLAKLVPLPGQLLWDVGLGSGSVAIEWMREARGARAVGVEPRAERRAMAAANALALGVPGLEIVAGEAPGALAGLPAPDAVFLGGGLSEAAFDLCWAALKPGGRILANAVTLESQAALMALHGRQGGELVRWAVSRAEPVGRLTGWRPLMEVMQWSLAAPW
jgi:precorrin-6Y C5,15-methyltransferase (decarboxylating)